MEKNRKRQGRIFRRTLAPSPFSESFVLSEDPCDPRSNLCCRLCAKQRDLNTHEWLLASTP